MAFRTLLGLSSVLVAFLYTRKDILVTFYTNHPSRMPRVNALDGFDVRFKGVVGCCEDAYMNVAEGWALLSCDPGRVRWNTVLGTWTDPVAPPETGLYLYYYAEGGNAIPEKLRLLNYDVPAKDLHPLGIEYHEASRTIYMVNHAEAGSRIDVFRLNVEARTATHVAVLQDDDLLPTPNSITVGVDETELFVTNDHFWRRRHHPLLATAETYLAFPRGNVVHVRFESLLVKNDNHDVPEHRLHGLQVQPLASLGFANGVVLLNATTLAVASTNGAAVQLYHVRREEGDLAASGARTESVHLDFASRITTPFLPDNLSVDDRGVLLIAGHPHSPSLDHVLHKLGRCRGDTATGTKGDQTRDPECEVHAPSWISTWTAAEGLRTLYAGDEFGSTVTAVRDHGRGVGLAVGLYEEGILTWKA